MIGLIAFAPEDESCDTLGEDCVETIFEFVVERAAGTIASAAVGGVVGGLLGRRRGGVWERVIGDADPR